MLDTINKYKDGEFVYALNNPGVKLVIRRYVDRIYYCRIPGDNFMADLPFFEREITQPEKESVGVDTK